MNQHPVTFNPWEWVLEMEALQKRVDRLEHEVRGGHLVIRDQECLIASQAREIREMKGWTR